MQRCPGNDVLNPLKVERAFVFGESDHFPGNHRHVFLGALDMLPGITIAVLSKAAQQLYGRFLGEDDLFGAFGEFAFQGFELHFALFTEQAAA